MSTAFLSVLEDLQSELAADNTALVGHVRSGANAHENAYVELVAEQVADAIAALRPLANDDRLSL